MSNGHTPSINATDLLSKWGFEPSVFNADEARKEGKLSSVMEYPDWFMEVLGNIRSLDFIIITGPRGTGKSSIRRSIVEHCKTKIGNEILGGSVLCISIDHDCPNWVKKFVLNPEKPSVDYFCEEIIDQMLVSVLTFLEISSLRDKLDSREAFFLERHIFRLQETRPDDISSMAERLISHYKKIKNSEAARDLLSVITSAFGNQVSLENRKIETPAIDDLPLMIQIVKKCGFEAIYILVDEIDEYDLTTGKPDFAAEIVVPILSSINLLEKDYIGLKFFLSAPVYQRLESVSKDMKKEIRYDRTLQPDPYVLEWTDSNIATMLKKRLVSYSIGEKINSLNRFCSHESIDLDKQIITYAYNNPRHMIQFCDRITRYAARVAYSSNYTITEHVFSRSLDDFCKSICSTVYPREYISALINYKQLEIRDEDFARANKITVESSREILNELSRLRALKPKSVLLSGEKTYIICDPRVHHIVEKGIELNTV